MVACPAVVQPGELVDSAARDLQGTRTVVGNDTSDVHFAQERAIRIQLLDLQKTQRELLWMAKMHATKGHQLWQQEQLAAMGLDWSDVDDVAISAEVSSVSTPGSSAGPATGLVGDAAEVKMGSWYG